MKDPANIGISDGRYLVFQDGYAGSIPVTRSISLSASESDGALIQSHSLLESHADWLALGHRGD